MQLGAKVLVLGHSGMLGRALVEQLRLNGYTKLLLPTRAELDLTQQKAVQDYFASSRPDYVFCLASKVANVFESAAKKADFLYVNTMIGTNVVHACHLVGVKRFVYTGSWCAYPITLDSPSKEEDLLRGELDPVSEAYGLSKLLIAKLCYYYAEQYGFEFSMPMFVNLYGPHDNFDPQTAHVLPALLSRFYDAAKSDLPEVVVWGSGRQIRDFLYSYDAARFCIALMEAEESYEVVNFGCGYEMTIAELARTVATVVGFTGDIVFDTSMPDGTAKRVLDLSKLAKIGTPPVHTLEQGLKSTLEWYVSHKTSG